MPGGELDLDVTLKPRLVSAGSQRLACQGHLDRAPVCRGLGGRHLRWLRYVRRTGRWPPWRPVLLPQGLLVAVPGPAPSGMGTRLRLGSDAWAQLARPCPHSAPPAQSHLCPNYRGPLGCCTCSPCHLSHKGPCPIPLCPPPPGPSWSSVAPLCCPRHFLGSHLALLSGSKEIRVHSAPRRPLTQGCPWRGTPASPRPHPCLTPGPGHLLCRSHKPRPAPRSLPPPSCFRGWVCTLVPARGSSPPPP